MVQFDCWVGVPGDSVASWSGEAIYVGLPLVRGFGVWEEGGGVGVVFLNDGCAGHLVRMK